MSTVMDSWEVLLKLCPEFYFIGESMCVWWVKVVTWLDELNHIHADIGNLSSRLREFIDA